MSAMQSDRGLTLFEVLMAISLIFILLLSLLPIMLHFRELEVTWTSDIQMEQEAMRFFTYLENRNACLQDWNISGNRLRLTVCNNGKFLSRLVYQDGERVVEIDYENGGYLILAQMVEQIHFYEQLGNVHITMTLKDKGNSRTFRGVLSRSIYP